MKEYEAIIELNRRGFSATRCEALPWMFINMSNGTHQIEINTCERVIITPSGELPLSETAECFHDFLQYHGYQDASQPADKSARIAELHRAWSQITDTPSRRATGLATCVYNEFPNLNFTCTTAGEYVVMAYINDANGITILNDALYNITAVQ